ncbi:hypothetical protein CAPTEDRAFT_197861 [Capitella teleta]|uniref:Receptor ligand binding region domain-containing protein n=1 Tax=Capitella teleta TaxID=283909 RepID=R7VFG6_CAPTE|nr:hypothetical protein CAPTEDRAFT_197861 [Capitella teleta]|eukprot:ELU17359.1 hypothetical protein CAPTEDRAFT_197861 [Capitella teleta]
MGMEAATHLYEVQHVDAILGSFCSPVLEPIGHYWTVKNIPTITHGATDPALEDKKVYTTLMRLGPTYNKYGAAFVAICQYYQWDRVAILAKNYHTCEFGASSINMAFSLNNLTFSHHQFPSFDVFSTGANAFKNKTFA